MNKPKIVWQMKFSTWKTECSLKRADLLKIYKDECAKYTRMQHVQEERVDEGSLDIVAKYEREKEYLDKLLKQFMDLIA